jgi:hypothetical protein
MNAWLQNDLEQAVHFFIQAVSRDTIHFDAWLRLAETKAAMGHHHIAKRILAFTAEQTDHALRWKWPQAVLACELGMDAVVYGNLNALLDANFLVQDTLQLLHTHLGGHASAVVAILAPDHLSTYLEWLMRWGMTEETMTVWQALKNINEPEKSIALRYAHFLLGRKRIEPAKEIWQEIVGNDGLTNPGFEEPITRQGFDWRYWDENDGHWELARTSDRVVEGDHALKVTFNGSENLFFQHLYQIVPTTPGAHYQLAYSWKAMGVTTDQGPYVEISGYNAQGLYQTGQMMKGTVGWQSASIAFTVPTGCHAALVRLIRRPSQRFDSKIRGTVWLDNFSLDKVAPGDFSLTAAGIIQPSTFNPLRNLPKQEMR